MRDLDVEALRRGLLVGRGGLRRFGVGAARLGQRLGDAVAAGVRGAHAAGEVGVEGPAEGAEDVPRVSAVVVAPLDEFAAVEGAVRASAVAEVGAGGASLRVAVPPEGQQFSHA